MTMSYVAEAQEAQIGINIGNKAPNIVEKGIDDSLYLNSILKHGAKNNFRMQLFSWRESILA